MTPTFRRFGVVTSTLGLALLAGPAFATTPDPRFSQVDPVVVGNSSGTPMGAEPAGYDVLIRDVNNAPVPGRLVTLDFSATAMKLYAVQNAGVTLDCASRQIHGVTNASGAIKFAPRIGGWENTNSVVVFNGGVELARVKGRSTDIDGADGTTGLGDFAIFG